MAFNEEGKKLNKRQRKILVAMWKLGALDKPVTTREIGIVTKLNINGIAQTIRTLPFQIDRVKENKGDTQWRLKNTYAATLF